MNMNARIVNEWDERDLRLGRPLPPEAFRPGNDAGPPAAEPETAVLAAITSGYEDARARIISRTPDPVPLPGRHRAAPAAEAAALVWAPTVPVDLASGLTRPPRETQAAGRPAGAPRRGWHLLRAVLLRLGTDLGRATPYPYS